MTFANEKNPNELVVVVRLTPFESVIDAAAFLRPRPSGVRTRPDTVGAGQLTVRPSVEATDVVPAEDEHIIAYSSPGWGIATHIKVGTGDPNVRGGIEDPRSLALPKWIGGGAASKDHETGIYTFTYNSTARKINGGRHIAFRRPRIRDDIVIKVFLVAALLAS